MRPALFSRLPSAKRSQRRAAIPRTKPGRRLAGTSARGDSHQQPENNEIGRTVAIFVSQEAELLLNTPRLPAATLMAAAAFVRRGIITAYAKADDAGAFVVPLVAPVAEGYKRLKPKVTRLRRSPLPAARNGVALMAPGTSTSVLPSAAGY
ncbi:hypothetical protein MTO96_019868 [Rhipicephalus appendiculatus]